METEQSQIIGALKALGFHAWPAVGVPDFWGVTLSLSINDLERILNLLSPQPVDGTDQLALRILGRGQDLTAEDEPWRFDLAVGYAAPGSGFDLRALVGIPGGDTDEVIARLKARSRS